MREKKGEDVTDFEDEGYTSDAKGFLREFLAEFGQYVLAEMK